MIFFLLIMAMLDEERSIRRLVRDAHLSRTLLALAVCALNARDGRDEEYRGESHEHKGCLSAQVSRNSRAIANSSSKVILERTRPVELV